MNTFKYYQITKYDTAKYGEEGYEDQNEWTTVWDESEEIDDIYYPSAEYIEVENQYVEAVFYAMEQNKVSSLSVRNLFKINFKYTKFADLDTTTSKEFISKIQNGTVLTREELGIAIRLILRRNMACRLEAEDFYLNFGYDFYIYIVCLNEIGESELRKIAPRMFVRPRVSPYFTDIWEDMDLYDEFDYLLQNGEDEELYIRFHKALETFVPEVYEDLLHVRDEQEIEEGRKMRQDLHDFLDGERVKGNFIIDQSGCEAVDVKTEDGFWIRGQYHPERGEWVSAHKMNIEEMKERSVGIQKEIAIENEKTRKK